MDYCKCGSLKIKGCCTNKRCKEYKKGTILATKEQITYIKELIAKAGKNEAEYNLQELTKSNAAKLILELVLEEGAEAV